MLSGPEPVAAADVYAVAQKHRIADATLKRAKARLGVRSKLMGFGRDGRWFWWLPTSTGAIAPESPREIVIPSGPSVSLRVQESPSELSDPLSLIPDKFKESPERSTRVEKSGGHDGVDY
jgi:hypothetical protein